MENTAQICVMVCDMRFYLSGSLTDDFQIHQISSSALEKPLYLSFLPLLQFHWAVLPESESTGRCDVPLALTSDLR